MPGSISSYSLPRPRQTSSAESCNNTMEGFDLPLGGLQRYLEPLCEYQRYCRRSLGVERSDCAWRNVGNS